MKKIHAKIHKRPFLLKDNTRGRTPMLSPPFRQFYKRLAKFLLAGIIVSYSGCSESARNHQRQMPEELKNIFSPPPKLENKFGGYRSPLLFESGDTVESEKDWGKRRREILEKWQGLMGQWPDILKKPSIKFIDSTMRGSIKQYQVEVEVAPGWVRNTYLLIPDIKGPLPAALVVYYEPETAIGQGKLKLRNFAYQLAKRGFVALSLGSEYDSNYYPNKSSSKLQPLSMLAYMAANCYHALANLSEVDPDRIGVIGHSYGGKWAMFASCLYDKFALGVWSDGGIVFDESRENVNYWEPWYLGYERNIWREPGIPTDINPRTGAYKQMIKNGWNLHELHALMAPRPFLVSGGSEDPPERWKSLNHAIEVNRLLGFENRVAMHNRPTHGPNEESSKIIYLFFEYFLK